MGGVKAGGGKKSMGKAAIFNTATEYAEGSSIHGISYIFDHSQGIVSRFAWLLIVMSAITVGVYWSLKVKFACCKFTAQNFTFDHYNHRLTLIGKKIQF